MKIGIGYDIHALQAGRPLILGGIEIPHSQGLVGHSDADALTHAVCDAVLGALGEGDLGIHFPSSNERFKNMSSLVMLKAVTEKLANKGYRLVNLDAVILAEAPRLGPYLQRMEECLAGILGTTLEAVNVKVKSGDKIGVIGKQEGIAAQAVCLIEPVP